MTKNLNELSGTELVNVMNEVMAEVKSRLVEGTVTKYVAREIPSTVGTVEHDGKLLRKVERKQKKGDYVRFQNLGGSVHTKNNIFYEIINQVSYLDDRKESMRVDFWLGAYIAEIFEVVSAVPQIIKSPNQQRAELNQRAREFVEGIIGNYPNFEMVIGRFSNQAVSATFHVNAEKRTVVALVHGYFSRKLVCKGIAKCMPGDVFNESIGKAIALAKALQIDIPQEFMQAVQPDEVVVGHAIYSFTTSGNRFDYPRVEKVDKEKIHCKGEFMYKDARERHGEKSENPIILDDTNATYESVGE